jgi:hypothetical protein
VLTVSFYLQNKLEDYIVRIRIVTFKLVTIDVPETWLQCHRHPGYLSVSPPREFIPYCSQLPSCVRAPPYSAEVSTVYSSYLLFPLYFHDVSLFQFIKGHKLSSSIVERHCDSRSYVTRGLEKLKPCNMDFSSQFTFL